MWYIFVAEKKKSSLKKIFTWTAEIGWTLWARRRVSAEHSERPIYLIFPSLTSSAKAPTVSSIGL